LDHKSYPNSTRDRTTDQTIFGLIRVLSQFIEITDI